VKTELANKLGIVDLMKGPDGPVGEQFYLWLQKATYQGREFYTLEELYHATQRFNELIRLGRLEIWHLLNDGTVAVVKTSIQAGPSAEFAVCVQKLLKQTPPQTKNSVEVL
jgi:hypothetical protein